MQTFSVDLANLEEANALIGSINVNIEQIPEVKKFSLETASNLSTIIMPFVELGVSIATAIKSSKGLSESFAGVERSIGNVSESIGDSLKKSISESLKTDFSESLKSGLSGLQVVISGMSDKLEGQAFQLGDNIAKGVAEGIKSGLGNIKMKTEEVGEGAIKEFRTTFEISSPSKVMKRLGGYISEGLGIGIKDGTKDVKNAMNHINDTVESSAKQTSKTKFSFGGIAAAATIVGTLVGYFVNLMSSNEELSGKMSEVWAKIQEALSPVIEVVTGLFDAFTQGGEGTTSMLDTIVEIIGGVAEFIAGVIESIAAFFAEHGDEIMAAVSTIWNFISGILEGAKEIIGGVLDIVVGIFTGNGEKIKEGFGRVWEGIKGIFSGVGEFFSGIWDKVVSIFGKVGTKIGGAIGGAFKTVVNTIIGFAEKTINGFLKAINGAIGLINKIPGVEIKKIELLTIPKLADGGLVSAGQVFVAREAGPELVGTFGARSAVMNNNQIVEAVSRGVYNAVSSAMGSGGSYTFNISNQLDGREIGKQVIKYHNGVVKQTGYSPLLI